MQKGNIQIDGEQWKDAFRKFGQNVLQRRRKQLGLVQEQIAERLNVRQATVSRWENGQERPRDILVAGAVAVAYELDHQAAEEWLFLNSGIADVPEKLGSLVMGLPLTEPRYLDHIRRILLARLSQEDVTINTVAVSANVDTETINQFLNGEVALDEETAFSIYNALHPNAKRSRAVVSAELAALPSLTKQSNVAEDIEKFGHIDLALASFVAHTRTVCEIRASGLPQRAIAKISALTDQLEYIIQLPQFSRERPLLLKLLQDLYHQLGWAYSEISSQDEVWTSTTGFAQRLWTLRDKYKERGFAVLAEGFVGDALYIAGRYEEALPHLLWANNHETDADHRLMVLQTLVKIWARTGRMERFKQDSEALEKILVESELTDLDHMPIAYGSLARAHGILGQDEAFLSLEKSRHVLSEIELLGYNAPIATVHLICDELEVTEKLDQHAYQHALQKLYQDILVMARLSQYQRLEIRIRRHKKKRVHTKYVFVNQHARHPGQSAKMNDH